MGAKTWMLVHSKGKLADVLARGPALDREATTELVQRLFPSEHLDVQDDGDLYSTCPPAREIVAGCFPGVAIVAAKEFGGDYPSKLPARFIEAFKEGTLYLCAMHSVVDWAAYAVWVDGKLVRALSVAPDSGIIEDIGERLAFERPFWAGERPAVEPDEEYPLVFHPLELGDEAMSEFFGYGLEGGPAEPSIDPEDIALMRFARR